MIDARAIAGRAQAEASDPAVSAWVSANAGTGKTHVLVNRIIRLMLAGALPERILCLTFTRAAAAEMASRLVEELGRWIAYDDEALAAQIARMTAGRPVSDLAAARRLFARALETPGGLKVQTIHAFCERLLQRFPVEAGVTPGFAVLDPTASAQALAAARSAVLEGTDGDTEVLGLIDRVALHVDLDGLTDLVAALIEDRGRLRGVLDSDHALEATLARLAAYLGLDRHGRVPDLGASLAAAMPPDDMAALAHRMATSDKATDRNTATALQEALGAGDAEASYELLSRLVLTGKGEPRKPSTLCTAAMGDCAEQVAALQAAIVAIADLRKAALVHAATAALLTLGRRVIARYEAHKLAAAGYDYDDLISRTLELLQRSAGAQWVLYKLDGGLDHILIDEAQDTSPEQWDIVRLLADEFFAGEGARTGLDRTIFAVGDKKQSIFSFQGADPRLFDKMRAYFEGKVRAAGQAFADLPLDTSFRSVDAILGCIDEVFNSGAAAQGVRTTPGETMVHRAIRAGEPGLVEIWPLVCPPDDDGETAPGARKAKRPDARRTLADGIAAAIDGWLRRGEPIVAGGPPIRPADILILVQRRPVFMAWLVKALKHRAIPVAGPDRLELAEHVAVRDLVALGHVVLQPGDDLALAETLKSPLLARDDGSPIDDDDLFAIVHDRGKASLWAALRQAVERGGPYRVALARLENWRRIAAAATAGEFYQRVLAGGGLKALQARLGGDAVDAVESFLQLALAMPRDKVQSLRAFLDAPGGLAQDFRRDLGEGAGELRIMTVHGAKGLQAPIVIMADAALPPAANNQPGLTVLTVEGEPLPVWCLKKSLLPARLIAARSAVDGARLEEYNRLLYVAMTRARDRLYVAGASNRDEPPENTWHGLVSTALRPRASEVDLPDGRRVMRITDTGAGPVPERSEPVLSTAAELPAWALRPPQRIEQAAPQVSPSAIRSLLQPPHEVTSTEQVASPLGGDGDWRFRRGRLVHRLLQIVPDHVPAVRESIALRVLAYGAPDMPEASRRQLSAEVLAVIADSSLAALFGEGSHAEVPLVAEIHLPGRGKVMISGRLDRIAVNADEVLIADYKTNRPVPADPSEIDPAHIAQLAAYRAGLEGIYPGRKVRAFLVWTDGPQTMEIPGNLLAAALTTA